VVCTIIVVEHKQSVVVPIVVDNNKFVPRVWKCYVMYSIKKVCQLLGVLIKKCKPCGFSIMEFYFILFVI
jgi:hypothetical protein